MPTPTVSIVIPAWNRADHIGNTLQSVIDQSFEDWEVFVIDDGSTDKTRDIVRRYADRDPRLTLLQHNTQRGAQAARNTGIRAARGDWIAFLDSDDEWLPHSLEKRLNLSRNSNLSVTHSECWILNPNGEKSLFHVPVMENNAYSEVLRRPGPMFQGMLVKKEALLRIGLLDESIVAYQEWDTSIRLARHFEFGFVAEPTFIYDCRHSDTISKGLITGARGYEQVLTKHQAKIAVNLGPKAVAWHYQFARGLYRDAGDERSARRCLMMALIWWPFRPAGLFRRLKSTFHE